MRAFEHVDVQFNDYVCLVGPNGAGKSTILCALNIFFRQTEHTGTNLQSLDREDFFKGDTSKPIKISVTFDDLEEQAKIDLAHYVRADQLIVTAEAKFDPAVGKAIVRHYGERVAMPAFAPFFEQAKAGASATELNALYDELRKSHAELPAARSKDAKIEALRAYEQARTDQCVAIASQDDFYGVSRGTNLLERYVQWVYVPAVKDALSEQEETKSGALGKLLARAVRAQTGFEDDIQKLTDETRERYRTILEKNQAALDAASQALSKRLSEWAHGGTTLKLEWREDPERSVRIDEPGAHVKVGEGPFEGELARLGHGLQRSYIIALLQELALYDKEKAPRLLLAIEEPELYQHPPQARHLASVLVKLSSENAQVMISTHSPYFVSGSVFEDVRVVRRPAADQSSTVKAATAEKVAERIGDALNAPHQPPSATIAKLQQILQPQLAEMFFATGIVFVEGREDLAYIRSYLELSNLSDEFRKHGCHFVAVDGKDELLRPLIVAQQTGIPCFVIFDADGNAQENKKHLHVRDNESLLRALGSADLTAFPAAMRLEETFAIWPDCLSATIKEAVPDAVWQQCTSNAAQSYGHGGGLAKNVMYIGTLIEKLWAAGIKPQPLEDLAQRLLAFAAQAPTATSGAAS